MAISFNNCSTFMICIILLLPAFSFGTENYYSKATFYKTSDGKGTPTGACGYGEHGRYVNDGLVTTASWKLYKNGAGCGACYQVRCKDEALCSNEGVKVVVTDSGEGPGTDFILSSDAFAKMAYHPKVAHKLFPKGVVDVDYKRVSCKYGNLKIKINEHSNYHGYLALFLFNNGGYADIIAIEIYDVKSYKWIPMRRSYGAVFDLANPPKGDLKIKIQIKEGEKTKWIHSNKTVIPDYWKPGSIYETDIQIP
ncbi:hypothetical protein R3W88_021414 [Solanum pinnatisectum]|uniref:Expansin-like B1 n=1 Tax=Solanum pinnatisectum TaxID=50273 RepID=A0AAV9LRR9_9SOLN|nr:hypothetical protein R3W88_021414 [Solanum pinnatisectum]